MQSTSFRLVSALITLLLLAGLIWVVILVVRTAPSTTGTREATLRPTTPPLQTGHTLLVATQTTTRAAQPNQQRVDAGGFTFVPVAAYALELTATSATLTSEAGSIFLLRGGPPEQLSSAPTTDLDELFDEFVAFYASRDSFASRNKQTVMLGGVNGRVVDLFSQSATHGFAGRIAMAQPNAAQLFLLVAVSPADEWEATASAAFEQLIASLDFFPLPTLATVSESPISEVAVSPTRTLSAHLTRTLTPSQTPNQTPSRLPTTVVLRPTLTPTPMSASSVTRRAPSAATSATMTTATITATVPTNLVLPRLATAVATADAITAAPVSERPSQTNWRVYANGNRVNDLMVLNTTIWAATDGGVSRWNRSNNSFAKFTTLDGLAVNRTTVAIDCTLPGFGIIFGSAQGLQIFEPARAGWKTLNSTNSEMHFDDVTALYCSVENGFLVVGYAQHGLDIFDANSESWTLIDQAKGLPSDTVTALAVIGDREQIWIASDLGISVLTEDGVIVYDTRNTPLETNQVGVLVSNAQGVVWLGAGNKVYKIDNEQWTIYSEAYVLASSFPTGTITALALLDDGTLWIGANTGELCLFDPTAVTCKEFFDAEVLTSASGVTGLALDAQNRLYLATAQDGVRMYEDAVWQTYRAPAETVLGNQVQAFAQDADGLLWLATDAGLYQINPATERTLQSFTSQNTDYPVEEVVTLFPDPAGGLWVGGQGVGYFDGVQWISYTTADGLASDQVQAIAGDATARIWVGTAAGLSIWNGDSFFTLTRADRLPSDNILTLLADQEIMWIGSDAGLLRFEDNQFEIYRMANPGLTTAELATGNQIQALAKVADGALLVGTDRGLARWVVNEMNLIEETEGYSISAIGLAQADAVWVGTEGNGLLYFDGNRWSTPPQAIIPPSPHISAIAVDQQNSAWIAAAEGGLIRYIP